MGDSDATPRAAIARPAVWLALAVAGLALISAGVAVEVYRHQHSVPYARLISFSNPGVMLALGGLPLAAIGVLVAVSILSLRAPGDVMRRAVALTVAWASTAAVATGALTYVIAAGVTIGGQSRPSTAPGVTAAAATVVLRGALTLDGAPAPDGPLGARVIRDGLSSACQRAVAQIANGRYEIAVYPDTAARGCGAAGAKIVLWTFSGDRFLYTRETVPWPDSSTPLAAFDATFSTSAPDGAALPVTEVGGDLLLPGGTPVAPGAVVEAYVGGTRCGIASSGALSDTGYVMLVAGPELDGCAKDAVVTFRVNGQPIGATILNDMAGGAVYHRLTLTVP